MTSTSRITTSWLLRMITAGLSFSSQFQQRGGVPQHRLQERMLPGVQVPVHLDQVTIVETEAVAVVQVTPAALTSMLTVVVIPVAGSAVMPAEGAQEMLVANNAGVMRIVACATVEVKLF
jgi:hypothetical protein